MMNFDNYKNNLPYPTKGAERAEYTERCKNELDDLPLSRAEYDERKEALRSEVNAKYAAQFSAFLDRDTKIREQFRADIEKDLGVDGLPQGVRDALWEYVWEAGHSNGYSEVYNVALDVAPIVVAAYQAGAEEPAKEQG